MDPFMDAIIGSAIGGFTMWLVYAFTAPVATGTMNCGQTRYY